MQTAAETILEFTASRTLDDYLTDRMLRSAVERQFEIIGEALCQLGKLAPQLTGRIPDAPQIVAFRNMPIHGYASVNDRTVWKTVEESLPLLLAVVKELLDEAGVI
jgi:uncharacterized protein with HEPN domain